MLYTRLSRLLDDFAVARLGNGVGRLMRKVTKVSVLILDDWAMIDLTAAQRRDLMEIVDDRHDRGSIVLASQLPVESWHATIGDPTYADAILDRVVHNAIFKKGAVEYICSLSSSKPDRVRRLWAMYPKMRELIPVLTAPVIKLFPDYA